MIDRPNASTTMVRDGADRLERLAAAAGLAFALAVILLLAGVASDSLSAVYASVALALLATVLLVVATSWSAWRALSWPCVLVVACPLLTLPLSLRSSIGASGIYWLAVYLGSTTALAGFVGLAATRRPREAGRAVALSVCSALLLAVASVLIVLLLWHGDLN